MTVDRSGDRPINRFVWLVGAVLFAVREAATLSHPYGIDTIEAGGHVYVCTGLRGSWADLWPRLRRYA